MFLIRSPSDFDWLFRDQFTKDDIKVYAYVLEKPGNAFLNAGNWYDAVSSHLAARFVLLPLFSDSINQICLFYLILLMHTLFSFYFTSSFFFLYVKLPWQCSRGEI